MAGIMEGLFGTGGGGGGSQHDLGFYATASALRSAHPVATEGDFALVGETDTFWVWDGQTSAWVDSHKADTVSSVNGKTGAVVLTASDVGAGAPLSAGAGIDITDDVISVQHPTIVTNTTGVNINGTGEYAQTVVVGGTVSGTQAVAIGTLSRAVRNGTAIGFGAQATETNGIAVGNGTSSGSASVLVGYGASISGDQSVGVGPWSTTGSSAKRSTALGTSAVANAYGAIQIGYGTNAEAGTMCVALSTDDNTHPNYKLLDTDGTIPAERLVNASTATTATLTSAGWSSNTQTVSVTGLTATQTVFVAPAPASTSDYVSAGILCTGQAAGQLTFTCDSVPSSDITVNLVIMGA